jgi:hypothetical protein
VFESAAYAANFKIVGSETGDADRGEKTQERNGQDGVRCVTGKLKAISDRKAA